MMGSPYAMLEADVMVYAQPYKVGCLLKGPALRCKQRQASVPGCLIAAWLSATMGPDLHHHRQCSSSVVVHTPVSVPFCRMIHLSSCAEGPYAWSAPIARTALHK
jgi:hypothetical protein